ncbi:hypothetical protein D3C84_558560 [compost metagenome]
MRRPGWESCHESVATGFQVAAPGRLQRGAALVRAGAGPERGLRAECGPGGGPAGCGAQGLGPRLHRGGSGAALRHPGARGLARPGEAGGAPRPDHGQLQQHAVSRRRPATGVHSRRAERFPLLWQAGADAPARPCARRDLALRPGDAVARRHTRGRAGGRQHQIDGGGGAGPGAGSGLQPLPDGAKGADPQRRYRGDRRPLAGQPPAVALSHQGIPGGGRPL